MKPEPRTAGLAYDQPVWYRQCQRRTCLLHGIHRSRMKSAEADTVTTLAPRSVADSDHQASVGESDLASSGLSSGWTACACIAVLASDKTALARAHHGIFRHASGAGSSGGLLWGIRNGFVLGFHIESHKKLSLGCPPMRSLEFLPANPRTGKT